MATRIYNTTTNEVVEATVIGDGQDFLFEIMKNNGVLPAERDDAEFELDDEETEWWLRYARREQRIIESMNEQGEEAIMGVALISSSNSYNDPEELQDRLEEFLGIK